MSESLARRVARLVSGGFHAMLDKAEDCIPEAVMQENIRELERTIDEVRAELGKVLAQKHLATKKPPRTTDRSDCHRFGRGTRRLGESRHCRAAGH